MEQQKFIRKNTTIFDAQRRMEKKQSRRTLFYVFLFLAISLVFLAVCVAVFLKVETVEIKGVERYTYEDIAQYVPIETGDNIFSFNAGEIEQSILEKLAYVGEIEIERDLPTTVIVSVKEKKPYYAAELAGDTYLMSSDLKVLEKLNDTSAESLGLASLSLTSVRSCIVGSYVEFLDKRTNDALDELFLAFEENYIQEKIKGVDVRSRFDIYINYDDRFEVYLGDTDNIDIKIRFLVGIIDELEEGTKGKIDISNHREAAVALS